MPLAPGARPGVYEIVSVLGAGGMGEVYRARDTKLGREVAIKVILDVFAADPDRVARFQREAKVLASLNHPHIAALYGMEESSGQHFLVMELVEGQTLAERLLGGPMSVEETLPIALQIADALEGAHEKGIVPAGKRSSASTNWPVPALCAGSHLVATISSLSGRPTASLWRFSRGRTGTSRSSRRLPTPAARPSVLRSRALENLTCRSRGTGICFCSTS